MHPSALGPWTWPKGAPRRVLRYGAAVAAIISAISLAVLLAEYLQPPLLYWRDFMQDWLWAQALRAGHAPYTPTPDLAGAYLGDCCSVHLPHASPHPPLAGLLILPLSWLDLQTATLVWVAIELACLACALWRLTGQPLWGGIVITGVLLAWPPIRTELAHGQFTTIQLLLLVLAREDLRVGRERRAGVLLGLALCVKPILLPLVLLFVLRRQTAVLLGLGAAVLGISGLSLLILGPAGIRDYLWQLPQTGQIYQDYPLNLSVWVTGWKLVPFDAGLATTISLMAGLLAVGGVVTLIARAQSMDFAYGALVAASTILNPVAWDIYAVLALLPLVQLVPVLQSRGWPRRDLGLLLLLGLGSLIPPDSGLPAPLNLLPMLVLLVFTLYVGRLAVASPGSSLSVHDRPFLPELRPSPRTNAP